MATRAKHTEKVEFHDGTEQWLRPLSIKNLRTFMSMLDEVREEAEPELDDNGEPIEEDIDELGMLGKFIGLALFCVNSQRADDKQLTVDELEEMVDMPTVQDIMRICAGIELGNPTATTTPTSPLGRR